MIGAMTGAMIGDAVFTQTLLAFFDPVRHLLDDPTVSEIMINGPKQIYVERRGCLERVEVEFENAEALVAALRNLSQFTGRRVDERHPILEGRLPDGSRVQALLPPVSPDGPTVSIRRFSRETLTIDKLVELGAMTPLAARALAVLVAGKVNIVVSGGTGSGKTSLLNALTGLVPEGERVVVIEDSREVQPQRPHVVQLVSQPPDPKGLGGTSIRDLFRATLRMRPDRIIVGEIRGSEALEIIQAMISGHGGCMGTLHATYPKDSLVRLETMSMMGDLGMPLPAIRAQIGAAVQLVVQVARLQDGSRKVTHLTEVQGYDPVAQAYRLVDLFVREYETVEAGPAQKVVSRLKPRRGAPRCVAQLAEHGLSLPPELIASADPGAARREPAGGNER